MANINIGEIVYTPQEAAALTAQMVQDLKGRNEYEGIESGLPDLDKFMLPLRGPILTTIIAYTSWGKTSWMNHFAKQALDICKEGDCVVKCTWEQSVEEDTMYWIAGDSKISVSTLVKGGMGDNDWDKFMKSYKKRAVAPLWIVGHSSVDSRSNSKIRPRLTMTNVMQACEYIMNEATSGKNEIKFVVLDYLQRIRPDKSDGNTRRIQMVEAVNKAKDLAIALGVPVMLGVQSKRDVLDRDYKQPRIDDGQETSNIEQSSQVIMSLWYPIKTEMEGKEVMINDEAYTVNKNLISLAVLKQTWGVAPVVVPMYFDPERATFGSMTHNLPRT